MDVFQDFSGLEIFNFSISFQTLMNPDMGKTWVL